MDRSDSRNAHSPEVASDDSASPRNPQPAETADLLAFEPVPLRHREDGLTPEKQRAYVEALADTGIAREAAARVGLSEQAINRVRRRTDARSFDSACEAAHLFGARRLRSIAYERAIEGTLKGHYYHGERVSEERVYDNRLLIYLHGKVAHLLEPPRGARAICDHWEDHMDALERGLAPPDLNPPAAKPERPEFTGDEVEEDVDGIWWTEFPPPEGFDGEEQGEFGDDNYKRTLSPREQAVLDADLEEEREEERAAEAARRDRFFGFAGDEISSSREAEPYETSEPSGGDGGPSEGPIEFKSAVPPVRGTCLAPSAGIKRIHAEARRRGGVSRFMPVCAFPPATAGSNLRPASPEEHRKRMSLRASAPQREPKSGRSARKRRRFVPTTSKSPLPGILTDEPPGEFA